LKSSTSYYGSDGGGKVFIQASSIAINGSISANGDVGGSLSGSGAGGSIRIETDTLKGSGIISANGGSGSPSGYAGGGGRVAIYTNDISGFDIQNVSANGYGAGTVYLADTKGYRELRVKGQSPNCVSYTPVPALADTGMIVKLGNYGRLQVNGDCKVTTIESSNYSELKIEGKSQMHHMFYNGGGLIELVDTLSLDTCVFDSNTTLTQKTMTANRIYRVAVIASYFELKNGSKIDVTGKGYPRGCSINEQISNNYFRGGSHAGIGKSSVFSVYDSYLEPEYAGAGGGSISMGAAGGGIVRLIANKVICNGKILANGATDYYGDGAGGSIWINAESVDGTGSFQANGGNFNYPGGGGYIAIDLCNVSQTLVNQSTVTGYVNGSIYLNCAGAGPIVEITNYQAATHPCVAETPAVLDVDNDGHPEIALTVFNEVRVYNGNGTLRWNKKINIGEYYGSAFATSDGKLNTVSAFEYFNNGKMDVLFQTIDSLYIFQRNDGKILFQDGLYNYGQSVSCPVLQILTMIIVQKLLLLVTGF
jgi:hypothetical protein